MKNIPLYPVQKINDLREMIKGSAERLQDKTAFLIKDPQAARAGGGLADDDINRPYYAVSYAQFYQDINHFGTWLMQNGPVRGRVAILAENRYEWYVTYLACINGYGIVIPLDKEQSGAELQNMLERAAADIVVYSAKYQDKVDEIQNRTPAIRYMLMDKAQPRSQSVLGFWNCLTEGGRIFASDSSYTRLPIDPEELAILLFTSGTTARPKAVMHNHRSICSNLEVFCQMIYFDEKDTFLSVLPLNHTYECTLGFLVPIYRGAAIAVCEGLRYISQNCCEAEATVMMAVPLIFEHVHRQLVKLAKSSDEMKGIFQPGANLNACLDQLGQSDRQQLLDRCHHAFGDNIRLLISGGAAVNPAVLRDFRSFGFTAIQGYGVTEFGPIFAVNRECYYKDEAVGLPVPDLDVKILDPDEKGTGEILGRSTNLMLGYYQDEAATRAAIDSDGFYHTGDFGYLDEDGFIVITGRKANIIVTKNGKNTYPEELEFRLIQNGWIKEAVVSGVDCGKQDVQIHAEVFPDIEQMLEDLGKVSLTVEEINGNIKGIIKDINHRMPTYKYIRSFALRDREFEKTAAKKIKRH